MAALGSAQPRRITPMLQHGRAEAKKLFPRAFPHWENYDSGPEREISLTPVKFHRTCSCDSIFFSFHPAFCILSMRPHTLTSPVAVGFQGALSAAAPP